MARKKTTKAQTETVKKATTVKVRLAEQKQVNQVWLPFDSVQVVDPITAKIWIQNGTAIKVK